MNKTFVCARCEGEFPRGDEEKTLQELRENFGDVPLSECEEVCDNCWEKIRPIRKVVYYPS